MFKNENWIIYNGQTGDVIPVEKFPFEIGSGDGVDLRLIDPDVSLSHCTIGNDVPVGLTLTCAPGVKGLLVNGSMKPEINLAKDRDFVVMLGQIPLAVRGGENMEQWLSGLNPDRWKVYDPASGQAFGPFPIATIINDAREKSYNLDAVVHLDGMETGLRVHQLLSVMKVSMEQPTPPPPESAKGAVPGHEDIATDQGELTCPVCWLKFDLEDIMHVATHQELVGDPVLGEGIPTRFHATRFDEQSRALDPKDSPCTETACPHCRLKLPFDMINSPSRIISIVGNAQSGKSYYLAVLSKLLPEFLYRQMNVVYQDANPAGNAKLSDLRNTLFGAKTPGEAVLAKTKLEDDMYARCLRYDREVFMPLPFIYSLSREGCADRSNIVFYDNAGEHFQPGVDINLQPGAQHISQAAGILFMFDPFHAPGFRDLMRDGGDPQLEKPILDEHDVLLSEMKVRVQRLLNLPTNEKTTTPLAVILGKADGWMHALPAPLRTDITEGGRLNQSAQAENSALLRQFTLDKAPRVVANAEAFSSNVKYFAISSFGHIPVAVQTAEGFNQAPDPARLKPLMVEAPVLWIFSKTMPGLIPNHA